MHSHYFQCWWVLFLILFLTHRVCLCDISDVSPCSSSSTFLFSSLFKKFFLLKFFLCLFQEWSRVYFMVNSSCAYKFDKISVAEFGFEKHSRSSEEVFFFFHLRLFGCARFQYSQVLIIFHFSKCSDSFLFDSSIPSVIQILQLLMVSMVHLSVPNLQWFFFKYATEWHHCYC